jgi:hypothetical protein
MRMRRTRHFLPGGLLINRSETPGVIGGCDDDKPDAISKRNQGNLHALRRFSPQ